MSESDTMFNERDRRCAAVHLMLSTDPSYDNRTIASTLKMQIWIATNNRNVPRVMKAKFPATVMVFAVVSSEGHIMPPHIFEVSLKVNTKVYLDVLKSVVIPGAIRWLVADPGCGSRTRRRPTSPKRPRLGFWRSATTLYPSLTGTTPPPTWTRWTTSFGYTSRTSPTWPPTTPKPAWSPPSAEYSSSSRWRLWKRHAPSSGSVLRRWLKLKAATVNTCHVFVAASHQTRLDTRSKARRPIKVGIKGRGRSGTSRDSNPACLCCSSAHLVQCEPDEASSFTNPNVGPGTYAS